jgi:hypothetical protein
MVPSKLEEASRLPSGLNETLMIQSVWPTSVQISSPLAGSQILTVRSVLPEARKRPSGL